MPAITGRLIARYPKNKWTTAIPSGDSENLWVVDCGVSLDCGRKMKCRKFRLARTPEIIAAGRVVRQTQAMLFSTAQARRCLCVSAGARALLSGEISRGRGGLRNARRVPAHSSGFV
jgi:hypothetical protein